MVCSIYSVENTTGANTGVSGVMKRAVDTHRASKSMANDHVTKRFGERLAALVPLNTSVNSLADLLQGFEAGERARGGEEARASRPSGKYVWQLLSRFLSGDTPSGLIPVPRLPDVDFSGYIRGGDAIVEGIVEDAALGVCFQDAAFCLSSASLDLARERLDWSLSTLGPCARSKTVIELCNLGSGRVGAALDMKKVGHGMGAGTGRRIFRRLGLKLHDVEDVVNVLSAWVSLEYADPNVQGNEHELGEENDGRSQGIPQGIPVPSKNGGGDREADDRMMMIKEVYPDAREHSRSGRSKSIGSRKQEGEARAFPGLTSSSDVGDEPTWEHVCCSISAPWIYVMEQAVATCGSTILWSSLSGAATAALAEVDFALVDEAAFRVFDERTKAVPQHVMPVIEECAALCRRILHHVHDVPNKVRLDKLRELQPLLGAAASQSKPRDDPRFDAARKAILGYRALHPGNSQLILISKSRCQALYEVLHDSDVSILQLSLPQHASYFRRGDINGLGGLGVGFPGPREPREKRNASDSISDEGRIWNEFDCFFLSTDDDTIREATNSSIVGFFKRIVLLETDPTRVRALEPLLHSLYNQGISICLLRVGLGLVGASAFRLEVPESPADGTDGSGERHVYENLNTSRGQREIAAGIGVCLGVPHGAEVRDDLQDDHREAPAQRCGQEEMACGDRSVCPDWLPSPLEMDFERSIKPYPERHISNPWQIQSNTSLGDTSLVKAGGLEVAPPMQPSIQPLLPHSPRSPFYQVASRTNDRDCHIEHPRVPRTAGNLFSDREESFLHDSFFERNSARDHLDGKPREDLYEAGWTPFYAYQADDRHQFDATPYLHASNCRVPSPTGCSTQPAFHLHAPGPNRVHVHAPRANTLDTLFDHHENAMPVQVGRALPLDQMVDAGTYPATGHQTRPVHRYIHGKSGHHAKLDPMYEMGGRSPFSPLEVMHAEDPFTDGGETPIFDGHGQRAPGASPYMHSHLRSQITGNRPQDAWTLPHRQPQAHMQLPTPYSTQRMVSPVELATPPQRFWPQPMNTVQAFNNIEKMYDEMRQGRPKRRPQRRGERFKRFK